MSRILVVEDEPGVALLLEKGLLVSGYTPTLASDATTAVAWLSSTTFDLIILDVGLPGVDGLVLLRDLRLRDRRTPVVVVSGHATAQDVVAGLEAGADDYLTKPFRFEELLARVRARLREDRSSLQ